MCSSISTPNPNPNWLDRLRSSKGFSTSPDLQTIDQFLSSNMNPNPNAIPRKQPTKPQIDKAPSVFKLMSDVISDLFVMGNSPNPSNPKKTRRKQPNPRICNGGAALSGNNSAVGEGKKRKLKARKGLKDLELLGFSRTEVTVVDTSLLPDWKGARVLYRKGMVWKVRVRKVVRAGWKKRKLLKAKERNEGVAGGMGRIEQFPLLVKGCARSHEREDSKESDDEILKLRWPRFPRSPISGSKKSPTLRLKIICKKNGGS